MARPVSWVKDRINRDHDKPSFCLWIYLPHIPGCARRSTLNQTFPEGVEPTLGNRKRLDDVPYPAKNVARILHQYVMTTGPATQGRKQ